MPNAFMQLSEGTKYKHAGSSTSFVSWNMGWLSHVGVHMNTLHQSITFSLLACSCRTTGYVAKSHMQMPVTGRLTLIHSSRPL